jgi:hypothetical protein
MLHLHRLIRSIQSLREFEQERRLLGEDQTAKLLFPVVFLPHD